MPDGALPEELNMAILLAFLLLLCYGAGSNQSSAASNENSTDVLSLLDFKAATNDPTGVLRSWNTSVHHCDWTGVICSSSLNPGRVIALRIPGQSFSGEITPSLGNLTFLEIISLRYNGFSGHLPPLNQLHELRVLDLKSNSFQGIIPDSIMNCSKLRVLDLSRNMLEGPIPTKVGSLHNLQSIDLSQNNLTGVIPSSISNATKLRQLDLRENKLGGNIADVFGQLSQLSRLDLSYNNFQGAIPP